MDKGVFLDLLQESFQRKTPLAMDMLLADIPEWDSLTAMLMLAIAKQQFGKNMKITDLKKDMSIGDIYGLLMQP